MRKNLEQKRAEYALKVIKKRLKDFGGNKEKKDRYLSRVKSLPATIIMCGLGQTAAMLISASKGRNDEPDKMLYEDLQNWICSNQESGIYQEKDLIESITENDRRKYIKAQAEVLKLLEWLKKFAVAYLSDEVNCDESTSI